MKNPITELGQFMTNELEQLIFDYPFMDLDTTDKALTAVDIYCDIEKEKDSARLWYEVTLADSLNIFEDNSKLAEYLQKELEEYLKVYTLDFWHEFNTHLADNCASVYLYGHNNRICITHTIKFEGVL